MQTLFDLFTGQDGEDVYSAEIKEDLEEILHQWFSNPTIKKNR